MCKQIRRAKGTSSLGRKHLLFRYVIESCSTHRLPEVGIGIIILSKHVPHVSWKRWKGDFVILNFVLFTYGSLEKHNPAFNPEACHWLASFSFMGGN